jgi:hypothetical protein
LYAGVQSLFPFDTGKAWLQMGLQNAGKFTRLPSKTNYLEIKLQSRATQRVNVQRQPKQEIEFLHKKE